MPLNSFFPTRKRILNFTFLLTLCALTAYFIPSRYQLTNLAKPAVLPTVTDNAPTKDKDQPTPTLSAVLGEQNSNQNQSQTDQTEQFIEIKGNLGTLGQLIQRNGKFYLAKNVITNENIQWHTIRDNDLANNSVTSRIIKDHSIQSEDLDSNLTMRDLTVNGKLATDKIDLGRSTIIDGELRGDWSITGGLTVAGILKLSSLAGSGNRCVYVDSTGTLKVKTEDCDSNGGSDNLGNHTLTQNLITGNHYLSGDGDNEGIFIDAQGNVGIGMTSPESQFEIAKTTDSLGSTNLSVFALTVNPSSNQNHSDSWNSSIYSPVLIPAESTHDVGFIFGAFNDVGNYGTGYVESIQGMFNWAYNGADANIGEIVGTNSESESDAGHVFALRGSMVWTGAYGGSVVNHFGEQITMVNDGAAVTNRYGIAIDAFEGSAINDFGIWQGGSAQKNYFAGNVGIGTTEPIYNLEVNGTLHSGPDESLLNSDLQDWTQGRNLITATNLGDYDSGLGIEVQGLPGATIWGLYGVALTDTGHATGVEGDAEVTGANGFATGIETYAGAWGASATNTTLYGAYIYTNFIGDGASVANNYGLYMSDQSGVGAINSFNLYSVGTNAKNIFEGKIGIGTTNPGAKLEINSGSAGVTGMKLTQVTSGSSAGAGNGKVLGLDANGNIILVTDQVGSGTSLPTGTLAGQTLYYNGSNWVTNVNLFNNAGNIGIGTTNPIAKLDVNGNLQLSGSSRRILGDFGGSAMGGGDKVVFQNSQTNGLTFLRVTPNGNGNMSGIYFYDSSDMANAGVAGFGINNERPNELALDLSSNGTGIAPDFGIYNDSSSLLTIKNATGNVGIGTTNPIAGLEVAMGILAHGSMEITDDSGYPDLAFNAIGNGGWHYDNGSVASLIESSQDPMGLAFYVTPVGIAGHSINWGDPKMVISDTGNVGIGTTNPVALFQVSEVVSDTYDTLSLDANLAAYRLNPTAYGSAGGFRILVNSAGAGNFSNAVYGEANVINTGFSYGTTSGGDFEAYHGGSGTIANAYGLRTYVENDSGTMSNATGVHIGGNYSDSGEIVNSYGLFIEDQASGTNNWNIYSDGSSSKSYFAGNVGIGTTNPGAKLDIIENTTALPDYKLTTEIIQNINLSAPSSKYIVGLDTEVNITGVAPRMAYGGYSYVYNTASGDMNFIIGQYAGADHEGAGTVTENRALAAESWTYGGVSTSQIGLDVFSYVGDGNIISNYGVRIKHPYVDPGGTINNNYGIYIDDQAFGTKNYAMYYNGASPFVVTGAGNVGIGTTNPTQKLTVAGNINVVGGSFIDDGTTLTVPDYVFEPGYNLKSLPDLETYINQNLHLPNVPSQDQIKKTGMNYGSMLMSLLEKTEENTLYTIDNYHQITQLDSRLNSNNLSTDDKMNIISQNLTDLNLKNQELADLQKQAAAQTKDLASLQKQMDELQAQAKPLIDFYLAMDLKDMVLKDTLGNITLLDGKITAKDIEALNTFKAKDIEATDNLVGNNIQGQNLELGTESRGQAVIKAGEKEVVVESTFVDNASQIYLTPLDKLSGRSLYIDPDKIEDGASFSVDLDGEVLDKDIRFNWLIIK